MNWLQPLGGQILNMFSPKQSAQPTYGSNWKGTPQGFNPASLLGATQPSNQFSWGSPTPPPPKSPQMSYSQLAASPYQQGWKAQWGQSSQPKQQAANPLQSMMGGMFQGMNPLQMFGGLAMNALGGALAPKVKPIDLSQLPSYQNIANYKYGQMDPALQKALEDDLAVQDEEERKQFRNRWKNLRPGADIETDSVFKSESDKLENSLAERRANLMAKNALQFNEQEMNQLRTVAEMDIASIMAQTGLDIEQANQFKNMFSSIGQGMINQGMGMNKPNDMLYKLFQGAFGGAA